MPKAARRTAATIAIAVMLGYSLVATAVGSFYPFSVFPMYAADPGERRVARLAARTGDGVLVEVTEFTAFACDRAIDPDRFVEACGPAFAPRYLDDELAHHVRSHAAEETAGESIEIVRRVWTIAGDGTIAGDDCVLALCAASR